MNARFFDVKKAKQDAIINAALKIFAENGYKNASTDIIVKEAGISKGLLFHYFISKQGLYGFIFDYSVKYMTLELTRAVNKSEKDFFEVQLQIERAKGRVLKQYPYMQQFLYTAQYEENEEAIAAISEEKTAMVNVYNSIYSQTDNTKFLDKVDINRVIDLIRWMSDGLARDKYLSGELDFDQMIAELEKFLNMLKRHFYRSPGNEMLSIAMDETGERDDSVMEQFRMDMTFEERLMAGKRPLVETFEEEIKDEEESAKEDFEQAEGSEETVNVTEDAKNESDGNLEPIAKEEIKSDDADTEDTLKEDALEEEKVDESADEKITDDDSAAEVEAESETEVETSSETESETVAVSTGNVELKVPTFEENTSAAEIKLPSWWTEGNGETGEAVPATAPKMSIPEDVLHSTLETPDEEDEEDEDEPWSPRPVKQIRL